MKYLLWITFLAAFGSILLGFFLDVNYSEKLIGFGTCGLFFIWIPLFTYHHWKNKNPKDYMLTNENMDKMRQSQKRQRKQE
jgi:hypothetical protein